MLQEHCTITESQIFPHFRTKDIWHKILKLRLTSQKNNNHLIQNRSNIYRSDLLLYSLTFMDILNQNWKEISFIKLFSQKVVTYFQLKLTRILLFKAQAHEYAYMKCRVYSWAPFQSHVRIQLIIAN